MNSNTIRIEMTKWMRVGERERLLVTGLRLDCPVLRVACNVCKSFSKFEPRQQQLISLVSKFAIYFPAEESQ